MGKTLIKVWDKSADLGPFSKSIFTFVYHARKWVLDYTSISVATLINWRPSIKICKTNMPTYNYYFGHYLWPFRDFRNPYRRYSEVGTEHDKLENQW